MKAAKLSETNKATQEIRMNKAKHVVAVSRYEAELELIASLAIATIAPRPEGALRLA